MSARRVITAAIVVASGVTLTVLTVAWLFGREVGLWMAYGAMVFGCVGALGLIVRHLMFVTRAVSENHRQLLAWINVRSLLGHMPVNIGGWAMDPLFAEHIALAIGRERPEVVLEFGSGSSTILIASCLSAVGGGRLISLDHDPDYAERTRSELRLRGLDHLAAVYYAPLANVEVDGTQYRWYDIDNIDIPIGVAMLVVDGPPASESHRARFPAVPLLQSLMSDNCVILMDDGDRDDERWIAGQWATLRESVADYLPGGKGGWIIRQRYSARTIRDRSSQ